MTDLWATVQKLRAAFCRDVSELPEQWTEANQSTGCCHVSALVLQDLFGGEVLVGGAYDYGDDPDNMVEHYWLVIDSVPLDITRDQFNLTTLIAGIGIAHPPNATTRAKADLLAQLAGLTTEKAA